jgi:hypothetical protein
MDGYRDRLRPALNSAYAEPCAVDTRPQDNSHVAISSHISYCFEMDSDERSASHPRHRNHRLRIRCRVIDRHITTTTRVILCEFPAVMYSSNLRQRS